VSRPVSDGPSLAMVGAFPFPYPQGSQVFMADQARALMRAGAAPVLFTYGRGQGPRPTDLELAPSMRWSSPRAMRSGPQWGKPLADAALLGTVLRQSGRAFDFALAHNVEAACVALAARPFTGLPVVYVAHTILRHELSAYAANRWQPALDGVGERVDRMIARRVDGIVALTEEARRDLAPFARGPSVVLPPGHDPIEAPKPEALVRACARLGLREGGFVLYSGNLDGYQDLELLGRAANRLPLSAPPVVVATHDARGAAASRRHAGPLRIVAVRDYDEMRALIHAARILVLPRTRPGGFPVKLLNYMEAARPIVAFANVAVGLRDGESARLLAPRAGDAALADALLALHADPALCARLGAGARRHLLAHHDWEAIARRTLDFIAELGIAKGETSAEHARGRARLADG